MHQKEVSGYNVTRSFKTGPLFKVETTLIQNISFWVHFITKVSLFYFNLRKIRIFFIPNKVYFDRKIFVAYIAVTQNFGCTLRIFFD
jgi:hypothetical protein